MKLWPFGRKKAVVDEAGDVVPEEVKEYYESSRRDNVGVAWLLALGTLVLTVLLAIGLFFGGRWVYRKLANKSDKPTTQQPAPATNPTPSTPTPSSPNSNQNPSNNTQGGQGSSNQPAAPATPTPSRPTTPSTPPQTPTTGPTPTAIPSTGPSSDIDS